MKESHNNPMETHPSSSNNSETGLESTLSAIYCETSNSSNEYTSHRNVVAEPCSLNLISDSATGRRSHILSFINSIFSKKLETLSSGPLDAIFQHFLTHGDDDNDNFFQLFQGQNLITQKDMENPMYQEIRRSINDDFRNCFKIHVHAQRCLEENIKENPIHPDVVIDSNEMIRNSLSIAKKYIQTGIDSQVVRKMTEVTEAQCHSYLVNNNPTSKIQLSSARSKEFRIGKINCNQNEQLVTPPLYQVSRRDMEEISSTIQSSPSRDFEEITNEFMKVVSKSKVTPSSTNTNEIHETEEHSLLLSRAIDHKKLAENEKTIAEDEMNSEESGMDAMSSELEPIAVKTKNPNVTLSEDKMKKHCPLGNNNRTTEQITVCDNNELEEQVTQQDSSSNFTLSTNQTHELVKSVTFHGRKVQNLLEEHGQVGDVSSCPSTSLSDDRIKEVDCVETNQQDSINPIQNTIDTPVVIHGNETEAATKTVVLDIVNELIVEACSKEAMRVRIQSDELQNSSKDGNNEPMQNPSRPIDDEPRIMETTSNTSSTEPPKRRSNRAKIINRWIALDEKNREQSGSDRWPDRRSDRRSDRRPRPAKKKTAIVVEKTTVDDEPVVAQTSEQNGKEAATDEFKNQSSTISSSHPLPSEPFIVNLDLYKKANSDSSSTDANSDSTTILPMKPKRKRSQKRNKKENSDSEKKTKIDQTVQPSIHQEAPAACDNQYIPPQVLNQFEPTMYNYAGQSTSMQFTGQHPLHCDTYDANGFGQHNGTGLHYQSHQEYNNGLSNNLVNTDFPFHEYLNPGYNIGYQDPQSYSNFPNNL